MLFLIIFIYIILFLTSIFCMGVAMVWFLEWQMNSMYKEMVSEVRKLEGSPISGAVLQIKSYKIKEDYRLKIANIGKKQKFIIEKILLMRKGSLKKTSLRQGRAVVFTA